MPELPSADDLRARVRAAQTTDALAALEQKCFGRKSGTFTLAFRAIAALPPDERKRRAALLNAEKAAVHSALAQRRQELRGAQSEALPKDILDPTLELPPAPLGHLHPIPTFLAEATDVFRRMGFAVAEGPEIETEEHQFDLLNFPREHAARDAQDIFFLALPGTPRNRWLLRGHTSPVQIRYMRTHKPPFRIICPGKVYRRDDDATHSPVFHQVEGLMVGEDISLAHMKAVMIAAIRALIPGDIDFRFRTGYFPFVEPGLELDMRWHSSLPVRRGRTPLSPTLSRREKENEPIAAELRRSEGRWMEIAGCGMVHPNVLKNCGIDHKTWQGFAFGFGVERMIMLRHRIPTIRLFFENDPRFLEQF